MKLLSSVALLVLLQGCMNQPSPYSLLMDLKINHKYGGFIKHIYVFNKHYVGVVKIGSCEFIAEEDTVASSIRFLGLPCSPNQLWLREASLPE